MAVDPAVIGPATLSLTQSIGLFQAFLPSFSEIAKTNPEDNPALVQDVRMGELAAAVLTLGIGGMISALTGSPVPAIVSVISGAVLVVLYESALNRRQEAYNAASESTESA
jgi:hypothetical protein